MATVPNPIPDPKVKYDRPADDPFPRGFTRTPTRFFTHIVPCHTYVESVCCGLILSRTVGWGRQWVHIPSEHFCRVANCTRKAVGDALQVLVDERIIQRKPIDGVTWYRVLDADAGSVAEDEPEPEKIWVKCEKCKRPQIVEDCPAETWVVVPHTFFVSLPRTVEYAEWHIAGLMLMTIGRQESDAVSVESLVSISDRSRRAVQSALRGLESKGLIRRVQERAGEASLYAINREQFGKGVIRPMRRLNRHKSEDQAKQKLEKSPKVIDSHEGGGAVEFQPGSGPRRLIWCPQCRVLAFGRCITAPAEPPKKPPQSAEGAGPPSEGGFEAELTAYLKTWVDQMEGRNPMKRIPTSVVSEVCAILGDDKRRHLAFSVRCDERREYIIRQATGMGVFVGFARDVIDQEKQAAAGPVPGRVLTMKPAASSCGRCGGRGTVGDAAWETTAELRAALAACKVLMCDCRAGASARGLL